MTSADIAFPFYYTVCTKRVYTEGRWQSYVGHISQDKVFSKWAQPGDSNTTAYENGEEGLLYP